MGRSRFSVHTIRVSFMRMAAIAAALLMLTMLTVTRSQAAFSDTTENTTNAFTAGSVTLTDDDAATALFNATGMNPGTPVTECITLTYSGSFTPATVRMYGTATGALATYLDTTIEVGTGGNFGDCTGFTPSSTIYTGTLAAYAASHVDWASGLGVWSPAASPESRTLRFTVDVQDDNNAQGLSASADFTWEAQE
ncbi:MAG: TasA family protein [Actinomycetota bacterium]